MSRREELTTESRTETGLGIIGRALILVVASHLLIITSTAVSFLVIHNSHSAGDSVTMAARIFAWLVAVMAVVLLVITYVLYALGAKMMYGGRSEFGPKHAKSVKAGIVLLALSLVVALPFNASTYIFSINSATGGAQIAGIFLNSVITSAVCGLIYYAFIALFLTSIVRKLADKGQRWRFGWGLSLLTASQVMNGAIQYYVYLRISAVPNLTIDGFSSVYFSAATFIIAGYILSLGGFMAFLFAYQKVRIAIRTGKSRLSSALAAKRERIIYAEPDELVSQERDGALNFALFAVAGMIALVVLSGFLAAYYVNWFVNIALLLIIGILFCVWQSWVWVEQYLSRTRLKVYENGIVPANIPVSYVLNRREYLLPFTGVRGITLRKRVTDGKTQWSCYIIPEDGKPIEFYGSDSELAFYNFLRSVKDEYRLDDAPVTLDDSGDIKSTVKAGFREQLLRWGIKPGKGGK